MKLRDKRYVFRVTSEEKELINKKIGWNKGRSFMMWCIQEYPTSIKRFKEYERRKKEKIEELKQEIKEIRRQI